MKHSSKFINNCDIQRWVRMKICLCLGPVRYPEHASRSLDLVSTTSYRDCRYYSNVTVP